MISISSDLLSDDASLPQRVGQPEILSRKMASFLRITRLSDRLIYERTTGLFEFEWRMVMRLGFHGASLVWELAHLLDVDRAQASRAVLRLTELGLLKRDGSRGRLKLSPRGIETYRVLRRLSLSRNSLLLANIGQDERLIFESVLMRFHENVHHLLDGGPGKKELLDRRAKLRGDIYPPHEVVRDDGFETNELVIVPAVLLVLRAIRRNSLPVFRDRAGLSEIEWVVLAWISVGQEMSLTLLIANMERDKSQVGRAVKRLIDRDLIIKADASRRGIVLRITPQGETVFAEIAIELQRNEIRYLEGISESDRASFGVTLELLSNTALCILAYDRAMSLAPPSVAAD